MANEAGPTRPGFAVLLKVFGRNAQFPRSRQEVAGAVVVHLAEQVGVPAEQYLQCDWRGRAIKYHRAQVRAFFGFRGATVQDGEALVAWLLKQQVSHEQRLDYLREAAYGWCRGHHLEPPTPDRLERLIRSALRTYDERLCGAVLERLGAEALARLDGPIAASPEDGSESVEDERSLLAVLKADPGPVGLESVLAEVDKLRHLRALDVPGPPLVSSPRPAPRRAGGGVSWPKGGAREDEVSSGYVLAGQQSELERLQLQSRVWEPVGRALLDRLRGGEGLRALDVGCGCFGWLRLLSAWVGPRGSVTGTDVDDKLLEAARALVTEEALGNAVLVHDDLFRSELSPGAFDLVHARFEVAPLGRADEQLATYLRLAAPGGWIVLEDPDSSSWHFNPPAPAAEQLIALCLAAFLAAGGDFDAGRREPELLRGLGLEPEMRAEVLALPPGHPYLRLPLQFSVSLEPRLQRLVSLAELVRLRQAAETEIADPSRWGTTFTLIQTWAKVPRSS